MQNNLLIISHISRCCIAFVFLFHGIVPKLLHLSAGEVAMIEANNFPLNTAMMIQISGLLEVVFAAVLLIFYKHKWPAYLAEFALIVLLIDVALFSPQFLWQAFNPLTLNVSVFCLCVVNVMCLKPER